MAHGPGRAGSAVATWRILAIRRERRQYLATRAGIRRSDSAGAAVTGQSVNQQTKNEKAPSGRHRRRRTCRRCARGRAWLTRNLLRAGGAPARAAAHSQRTKPDAALGGAFLFLGRRRPIARRAAPATRLS